MDVKLYNGDCLIEMDKIPNKSIDFICTDLPYGTTNCSWDNVIPFEPMWNQINRVIKDNGAIALFGSEPFSTKLRYSNLENYKYDWYWDKVRGVGHLNAKKRPMMCVEDIMIFYRKQCTYNPQMRDREKPRKSQNNSTQECYGKSQENYEGEILTKRYPINLITYSKSDMVNNNYHPTQKPIDLLQYLIKTYTNENDTVLDFTMGSGSCGVASVSTNRNFIGIELDKEYFNIAEKRINEANMSIFDI